MGADSGYGQLQPADSTSDYNKISYIFSQLIAKLNTMKLVQVVAVHGGGIAPAGTVDVFPLVSQVDGNFNVVAKQGNVYGIPWTRVQGGQNAIICDPQVNDIGYVVASDRDNSNVKSILTRTPGTDVSGGVPPGTRRKFRISEGVYIGGCLNVAPNQYLIFTSTGVRIADKNGNSVSLGNGVNFTDQYGNVLQSSASGFSLTGNVKVNGTLEATKLQTDDQGLTVTGNISATGTITAGQGGADQVSLQTHTHSGVQTGGGTSGPPTPGS